MPYRDSEKEVLRSVHETFLLEWLLCVRNYKKVSVFENIKCSPLKCSQRKVIKKFKETSLFNVKRGRRQRRGGEGGKCGHNFNKDETQFRDQQLKLFHWHDVKFWRVGYQHRCRHRHLNVMQNYEVHC
ncbi:hypothetical protein TNCV_213171 [Trichonephila clavipes]|nr:hypothetical protein TNCV_213171 [Trichonephila clavipes]